MAPPINETIILSGTPRPVSASIDVGNINYFIDYEQTFIAGYPNPNGLTGIVNPASYPLAKPCWWLYYQLYYQNDSSFYSIADNHNGTTTIVTRSSDNFPITGSDGINVGDQFAYKLSGYWYVCSILQINGTVAGAGISFVIDLPFSIVSSGAFDTASWAIHLVNRLSRLKQTFISNNTNADTFYPNLTSTFVFWGNGDSGDGGNYIFVDASGYCQGEITQVTPDYNLGNQLLQVKLNFGLNTDSDYTITSAISVMNATNGAIPLFATVVLSGHTYSIYPVSCVSQEQIYLVQWNLPSGDTAYTPLQWYWSNNADSADCFLLPDVNIADFSGYANQICFPVGSQFLWLAWQNRYGGIDLFAFNYNLIQANNTVSYGAFRQGNFIRDLGKKAVLTYEISAPYMQNNLQDWFIDLQQSPKVWMSTNISIIDWYGVPMIDYLSMSWIECTIADSKFIPKTALSNLMQFTATIVVSEINNTFRG